MKIDGIGEGLGGAEPSWTKGNHLEIKNKPKHESRSLGVEKGSFM